MFRALICPSSGVCDYVVELPLLLYCSWTAEAGSPDTTPAKPHPNSKTQQSKNSTAKVVVQQHSRKFLKMDILMPETCWISKKENTYNKWHLVGFWQPRDHNEYVHGVWDRHSTVCCSKPSVALRHNPLTFYDDSNSMFHRTPYPEQVSSNFGDLPHI